LRVFAYVSFCFMAVLLISLASRVKKEKKEECRQSM